MVSLQAKNPRNQNLDTFVRRALLHPLRTLKSALVRLKTKPLEALPDCPDLFHVYRYLSQHHEVRRQPGGWEYRERFYPDYLTVGGACHAIFKQALKYCSGHGVDVGAGLWPLPNAIPVDVWRGPGVAKTISEFSQASLDFVFSSHCLEHNENWEVLLQEWISKVKRGGIIFLYLPHPDCGIWAMGSPFVGDGHKWTPSAEIIKGALARLSCVIEAFDDGPDAMLSFWVCARRRG